MLTKVKIIDNSGGIEARIIKILNKKSKLNVGSLVLVSILSNIPNSKVRKGQIYKALIVNDNCNNFTYSFLGLNIIKFPSYITKRLSIKHLIGQYLVTTSFLSWKRLKVLALSKLALW